MTPKAIASPAANNNDSAETTIITNKQKNAFVIKTFYIAVKISIVLLI